MAALRSLTLLRYFVICVILPHLKVEGKQNLVNLDENNWRDMLEGEWMVEFFAPWCPACKSLQPVWYDFSNSSNILKIKVGQVDVTTSPGLSGRFMVTALPTIYHVIKGEFRQYKGGRDKDALVSFIRDKKWTSIEPIPSWQSPSSFLRSVVSYIFKLSTVLRSIHNHLLEEYGLPAWGSYLILAVATIFIGTFLGLILVCIIDCISPPKSAGKLKSPKKEEIEELYEGDDIIDESGDNEEESQSETKSEGKHSQEEEENEEEEEDEDDKEIEEIEEEIKESNVEENKNVRKRKPRKAM